MRSLILLALAGALSAQTTLTLTGPPSARPGKTVNLVLSHVAGANAPTAIQWTLGTPAGYTATAAVGAGAQNAGKWLYCDAAWSLCLEVGAGPTGQLNDTTISSGVLGTYTITVPQSTQPGTVQFSLNSLLAVDGTGSALSASAGQPYSLNILDISDLNGDGKVDWADVRLMIGQVQMGTCTDDQNGDGKCNVLDVVIVLRKALGM